MNFIYHCSYIFLFIITFYFSYGADNLKSIQKNKYIFTFWEPSNKIPGYIRLCIQTWKKFLPEYNIILMDYKKVKEFLGEYLFRNIICKYMSFMLQADAIRVALLQKFGGIWMDADTIITNGDFLKNIENYDLAMIGGKNSTNIGFIYASKNSTIINAWLIEIIRRVKKFKQLFQSAYKNKTVKFNYLGNNIIDNLLKNDNTSKNFFILDRNKLNVFPEYRLLKNSNLTQKQRYIKLYFINRAPKILFPMVKGIIMLHNSFTPNKYKNMTEKQFLKEEILLSKYLRKILNK